MRKPEAMEVSEYGAVAANSICVLCLQGKGPERKTKTKTLQCLYFPELTFLTPNSFFFFLLDCRQPWIYT